MRFFQRKGLFLDRVAVTGQDLTGMFLWDNLIDLKNQTLAGEQPVVSSLDLCLKHLTYFLVYFK